MKNRPYIVQLSNKTEVKIDSDELDKILAGISTGSPIRVKRGILNPSFIVAIVGDTERWKEVYDVVGMVGSDEYNEKRERNLIAGCKPLKDIFQDTSIAMQLSTTTSLIEKSVGV